MSKRFCIGDIHGAYKALTQVLEKAKFDLEKDELIVIGDVCDGWPQVKECIDLLMKVKHLIYIIGNHDEWTLHWMTKPREVMWSSQGGDATFNSYVPQSHIDFFKQKAILWYQTDDNILFVHGGIEPTKAMDKQDKDTCLWDRNLFRVAMHKHNQKPNYKYGGFKEIYIGHTTTISHGTIKPINYCNVWNLDTGAGWSGCLTIMNRDTKEYWQSDICKHLYPNIKGR